MQLKFTNKNYLYGGLVFISLILLVIAGALPSWLVLAKNSICIKQVLVQDEKYNYQEGVWMACSADKTTPDGKCSDITWAVAVNPALQAPDGETQYINLMARIGLILMILVTIMNVINIFMGRDSFLDFGVDVNTLLGVAVLMGWFAHHTARYDTKCGTAVACGPVLCEDADGNNMDHESIFTFGLAFYLMVLGVVMQFCIGIASKFWPIDRYEKVPIDGVGTQRTISVRSAGSYRSKQ